MCRLKFTCQSGVATAQFRRYFHGECFEATPVNRPNSVPCNIILNITLFGENVEKRSLANPQYSGGVREEIPLWRIFSGVVNVRIMVFNLLIY